MRACPCCGDQNQNPRYNHLLMKCNSCGHYMADERFFSSDFSALYAEDYFNGNEYLNYLNDKVVIQKNFEHRLRWLSNKFGITERSHVLEIGAAYGFFGEILLKHNPTCKYTGYELSPEPAAWARQHLNLSVHAGDYLQAEHPEHKYSDVFMWDVIEHLPDPTPFLIKAHSEMQSNGLLHLTTGDIGRLLPRLQGRRWRMIHPPTHLHYFSRHSLTKLLHRCGFKVLHTTYPPVFRSLRQIRYSLFHLGRKKTDRFAENSNARYISINTFDIMFVIAQKIKD